MSDVTETTANNEVWEIKINKKLVKRIATITAATAAVAAAVFVTKNLSLETSENSVTLELDSQD